MKDFFHAACALVVISAAAVGCIDGSGGAPAEIQVVYVCPDGSTVFERGDCVLPAAQQQTTQQTVLSGSTTTSVRKPVVLQSRVGDKVEVGEVSVYVARIERRGGYSHTDWKGNSEWVGPPQGMAYIYVYATLMNIGESARYLGYDEFSVVDGGGGRHEVDWRADVENKMRNQLLYPGQSTSGYFVVSVPENASGMRLYYDFQTAGEYSTRAVWSIGD